LDCTTPTVETHILPKVTQLPPRRVLAFDWCSCWSRAAAVTAGLRRSAASREFRILSFTLFLCTA
jgi:hypothetical protein